MLKNSEILERRFLADLEPDMKWNLIRALDKEKERQRRLKQGEAKASEVLSAFQRNVFRRTLSAEDTGRAAASAALEKHDPATFTSHVVSHLLQTLRTKLAEQGRTMTKADSGQLELTLLIQSIHMVRLEYVCSSHRGKELWQALKRQEDIKNITIQLLRQENSNIASGTTSGSAGALDCG